VTQAPNPPPAAPNAQNKAQAGPPAKGPAGPQGKGPAAPKPMPPVQVKPIATAARIRPRHRGLILSFVVLVLVPFLVSTFYLWGLAQDQYASTTGFTVRQEEATSSADLLGGLSQFAGGGTGSDSDVLYEFIQSQEIVERIDASLDLKSIFSENWSTDPVFSLWKDASIEDLVWFWHRAVRISYDQSTGLMELRIVSPDPQTSQAIGTAIVAESQRMINMLNEQSLNDTMGYANRDLDEALERLKKARTAMTDFRSRTQIVDPTADIQGRMGVLNNLQQQLAQAMVDADLLRGTTQNTDPRVVQADQRIQVIRDRIIAERGTLSSSNVGPNGDDYPSLLEEFERLSVDMQFAEETYRLSLAAQDVARSKATRQSRYLAAYISPTLAETAEYPQRLTIAGLIGIFLLMGWAILVLVYYSLRDRR